MVQGQISTNAEDMRITMKNVSRQERKEGFLLKLVNTIPFTHSAIRNAEKTLRVVSDVELRLRRMHLR